MNIADKLLNLIDQKQNPCIIGLDPMLEQIPEHLKKQTDNPFESVRDTIIEFNKLIIDAVNDIIPAIKLQIAFYEQYGSEGIKAFEETIKYAKQKNLIVIGDVKRNDIETTAKAYAQGYLGKVLLNDGTNIPSFDVDFVTVNPYLGSDGIKPFLEFLDKGIFILVKTSNPSSQELQNKITIEGNMICEIVAKYVEEIGMKFVGERGYSSIGAVVAGTYPEQTMKLRKIMKQNIFLVPGYGIQGGKSKDIVYCFNNDGYGAIISSSRDIIFAYNKEPYKSKYSSEKFYLASREATLNMKDDILNTLKTISFKKYIF